MQVLGILLNIPSLLSKLSELKDDKLIVFNEEHPKNISVISVTFSVLKNDKLISFYDSHPLNI